jgi:hypothetical protein
MTLKRRSPGESLRRNRILAALAGIPEENALLPEDEEE